MLHLFAGGAGHWEEGEASSPGPQIPGRGCAGQDRDTAPTSHGPRAQSFRTAERAQGLEVLYFRHTMVIFFFEIHINLDVYISGMNNCRFILTFLKKGNVGPGGGQLEWEPASDIHSTCLVTPPTAKEDFSSHMSP